jgi:hypothetical protein
MRETLSLPEAAFEIIDSYLHLPLGGKVVPCPYHMNIRKERVGLRVLVGKGNPTEIIQEVKIWSKIKDFDLDKATISQIREFMIDRSIGVDCSGFIVHVMGYVITKFLKKKLANILRYKRNDLLSILRRKLRPVENIGADTLTDLENCNVVSDMNKILPGDFVRLKGKVKNSHHILLITRVIKQDGFVIEVEYVHSSLHYEEENGVKFGRIQILDLSQPLEKQNWLEIKRGKNYTYEGYTTDLQDNGIRRLKKIKIPHIVTVG